MSSPRSSGVARVAVERVSKPSARPPSRACGGAITSAARCAQRRRAPSTSDAEQLGRALGRGFERDADGARRGEEAVAEGAELSRGGHFAQRRAVLRRSRSPMAAERLRELGAGRGAC